MSIQEVRKGSRRKSPRCARLVLWGFQPEHQVDILPADFAVPSHSTEVARILVKACCQRGFGRSIPASRDMRPHGISVYAYLNLTGYGGQGDKAGYPSVSARLLKASLADALLKDAGVEAGGWRGRRIVGYKNGLSRRG